MTTSHNLTFSTRHHGRWSLWIGVSAIALALVGPLPASAQDTSIVQNVSVDSVNGPYPVEVLSEDDAYYLDRDFTITSMPPELDGTVGIVTANDDKDGTGTDFLTFDLTVAADVYVVYDSRATSLPDWMGEFSDTGLGIEVTDDGASPLNVFVNRFEAGSVALGGNGAAGAEGAGSNYFVLVVPDPPTFASEPGSRLLEAGQSLTLEAELTEPVGTVSYQWQKDGVDITGATSSTFSIASVALSDSGDYQCIVSDGSEDSPYTTATATITVVPAGALPVTGAVGLALVAIACAVSGGVLLSRRRAN